MTKEEQRKEWAADTAARDKADKLVERLGYDRAFDRAGERWERHDAMGTRIMADHYERVVGIIESDAIAAEGLEGEPIPSRWTAELIESERARLELPDNMVPLASAGGVVAWGVPID